MEKVEFKELMQKYSKEINIVFNEEQLEKLFKYMHLLIEWNNKINLTAIEEPKEIIIKHFIDSLTINKYINKDNVIVDVGTGAGFPGIPIKIYRPEIKVVLVDSLNKRINFLNEVIKELELKNIETVHSRVEEFAKNKKYRENYDIVTARAVANLTTLSEYLIPLTKIRGKCICMKGNDVKEEIEKSINAIKILGGKLENIDTFKLPGTDINRNIIIIDKVKNTPNKYPRKAGMPSKCPLE